MGSTQKKNIRFFAISCLALLLLALQFQPLVAKTDMELEALIAECPTGYGGRTSWPDLVGEPGCKAAASIKRENHDFDPIVLGTNTPVPLDYRCNRVRIFINGTQGLVAEVPHVG